MKCNECDLFLEDGQKFCPNCGSPVKEAISQQGENLSSKKLNKKNWIMIGATLIIFTIGAVLFLTFGKTVVKEISISRTEIELEIGQTEILKYEIIPNDASDQTVIWVSSDESVATVNDKGLISAEKEGVSKITVSSKNGKSAVCSLIVEEPSINLNTIYEEIGGSNAYGICNLASDNSFIEIDTNPFGLNSFTDPVAISMIEELHDVLQLPNSVYNKMIQTRALDGRQSEIHGDISISWTYHPDSGLDIIYENLKK